MKGSKTINKTSLVLLSFFFFSFLFLNFVSAVPPVTTTQQFTEGYIIEHSSQEHIRQNTNYTLNFFVRNISNGVLIDNSTTNCSFYMANSQGVLIYSADIDYNGEYWQHIILATNFSDIGVYPHGIACNGVGLGGESVYYFEVTETGWLDYRWTTGLIIFIILLSYLFIIVGANHGEFVPIVLGSFILFTTSLYMYQNGLGTLANDNLMVWSWTLVNVGIAAYFSIRSIYEYLITKNL